jgi:hypothetical protein
MMCGPAAGPFNSGHGFASALATLGEISRDGVVDESAQAATTAAAATNTDHRPTEGSSCGIEQTPASG